MPRIGSGSPVMPSGAGTVPKPLEEMNATELARYIWSDLKAPGREAELKRAEQLLSAKTGETRDVVPGSVEAWKRDGLEMPLAQLDDKLAFYEKFAPTIPAAAAIAEGFREARAEHSGTPGAMTVVAGRAQFLSSDTLRAQIAVRQKMIDDPLWSGQPDIVADSKAIIAVWQDVLARRASGELQDPGPEYLHHPEAVGSLEDPLLATADRGLRADGTRKGTYVSLAGTPIFGASGPSPGDVRQGSISDCWMMSALISLAQLRPEAISSAIRPGSGDRASVALYSSPGTGIQSRETTQIDLDFPTRGGVGGLLYAHPAEGSAALWPAVFEKAYAAQFGTGYQELELEGIGNRDDQTSGAVVQALVGGKVTTQTVAPGPAVLPRIAQNLEQRSPVIATWLETDPAKPRSAHAFAVTAVDPKAGIVTVRDPLGADSRHLSALPGVVATSTPGEFQVPEAVFEQQFPQVQLLTLE
ncbi:MAG: C2 family cysteine protease [Myxococcaceae bacterium]